MRSTLQKMIEQWVTRCPKSGRLAGFRGDTRLAKILCPAMGVLAIGWFLFRVVPKPSRAAYPCQRVAAGIGTGFLAYLVGLLLAYTGFRFIYQSLGVHEHWNNATEKKYSRNLGKKDGIEWIAISVE